MASNSASLADTRNIHWQRYLRSKVGLSPEEIAKQDNVSVEAVKTSITKIDSYRAMHTIDFANEEVSGAIIKLSPDVQAALARGLKASKRVKGRNGKTYVEHDHKIQIEAAQTFTELVAAVQPRGGKGVNVNVQANAQAAAHTTSQTKVVGFEDRLRQISKRVADETKQKSVVGTTFDEEELESGEEEGGEEEGQLLLGEGGETNGED